jgi:hypothetical protein
MGTPAIAYDSPGLRDSIVDQKTGILVKDKSPQNLASSALTLLKNPDLLKKFSATALAFSKQFNWDNTAAEFDKIITQLVPHAKIGLEKAAEIGLAKAIDELKKSEFKKSEQDELEYKTLWTSVDKNKAE